MELTKEERDILIQVISQLNVSVAQAETAMILKGILTKLQEKE